MKKNIIKYGLRNVCYSKITIDSDGAITYETPVSIPGGVNLSASAVGESNDFFADDIVYFNATANQGYEGDLEIALIPESFYTDILGMTKDNNGALVEDANTLPSAFALGFEVQGDAKGRKTWFYNCSTSRPNQDASTKEAGITPKTEKLSIKMLPRQTDKKVKVSMEESDAEAYKNFFNEVYEPASSI